MLSRRAALSCLSASLALPSQALARSFREITWDDLIPPGVPYSEIIAEGEMDEATDFWRPIYDDNATKMNTELDGKIIKMPGFVVPLDVTSEGVRDFILVPYVGACIHVPPPPANQLVLVHSETPWPSDNLWDAVWVTGHMSIQLQSTDLGQTGYSIEADAMEIYVW